MKRVETSAPLTSQNVTMTRTDWLGLFRILVLLALPACSIGEARADCTASSGMPAVFSYGSVAVSNTVAVGDVIPGTVKAFTVVGKCVSSGVFGKPIVACPGSGTEVSGMTGVYPTNVAGVGMRMRDSNGNPLSGTGGCSMTSVLGYVGADGRYNFTASFELVKTGTVSSGLLVGAIYYSGVLNTGVPLNDGAYTMSVPNNTPVTAITCNVTAATANQTITLATVSPSAFPAVGSTAARTSFSLDLSCQAGVKVWVVFSSTSGSSGNASALGNAGTAQSIGVQLLDATQTPITLDSPLMLTSSTTGNMSFPFFTQYIRTGATAVTAGNVRATAVFTLNYQ